MDSTSITPAATEQVVFGVYRDGDNNLDAAQRRNVTDFIQETASDRALKVVAEDTTSLARTPFVRGDLRTEDSIIQDGTQRIVRVRPPVDMSDRASLASFVERTLSAKAADPKFAHAAVWIDLVDHGGGDGGGLQADSTGGFMSVEDIAGAIADGSARFHAAHPHADAAVTGVVANQCLMATLGFADALSRAGVRFLAASPETMLAPGVPSAKVADALTRGGDHWPQAVVDATMRARYGPAPDSYHPAAAFDVFDLAPDKLSAVRDAVTAFDDKAAALGRSGSAIEALHDLRGDLDSVRGMARFPHSAGMPWRADRPAIAVYDRIASDARLPDDLRSAARGASAAIGDLVMAHGEARRFAPFGSSYADAAGPTEHFPVTKRSFDSWAGAGVSETHNEFYDAVDGRELARAVGSYNALEDREGAVG